MSPHAQDAVATHTFLFADLAGYTALTEAHGDDQAADAAADFFEHVRAVLPHCDGEEVKSMGDALMVRFASPHAAVRFAQRTIGGYGAQHRMLGVRIGMHTGTAVERGDDWFGSGVNLASRVADVARAGEVLLTEPTRAALGDGVSVRARGRQTFKNVAEPVAVYELVFGTDASRRALPIDPVCRMALEPELTQRSENYRGVEYLFCSDRCHDLFTRDPRRYIRQRSLRRWLTMPIRRRWQRRRGR
jgi:adenylate cyclase